MKLRHSRRRWTGLILAWVIVGCGLLAAKADDLREATFSQVVNSVFVSNPRPGSSLSGPLVTASNEPDATAPSDNSTPAKLHTKVAAPQIIRTGSDSRAELTAADQTVTRVGANTIFSFKTDKRGVNLQQGSVLFNSPTGRGGGTIQTAAATASVLGTTIIASTTRNGGFKLLVLEGHAKIELPNGRSIDLLGGQMTFILPHMTTRPQVFEFRLSKETQGARLMQGFNIPLPSQFKVEQAILQQEQKIAQGLKTDTGYLIGEVVGNGVQIIDANTLQAGQNALTNSGTLTDTNSTPPQPPQYPQLDSQFQLACTIDQNVSSSVLDSSNVIAFPSIAALQEALAAVGSSANPQGNDGVNTYNVFAARNLTISSPTVDLTPFLDADAFAFFGKDSLNISADGYVDFGSFPGQVVLYSDGPINIPRYTSLYFDARRAILNSGSASGITFDTVSVFNAGGETSIEAANGPIYLTNVVLSGIPVSDSYGNHPAIYIGTGYDLTINGGSFTTEEQTAPYVVGVPSVASLSGLTGLDFESDGNVSISNISYNASSQDVYIQGYNLPIVGGAVLLSDSYFDVNTFNVYAEGSITVSSDTFYANGIYFSAPASDVIIETSSSFVISSAMVVEAANISVSGSYFAANGDGAGVSFDAVSSTGSIAISDTVFDELQAVVLNAATATLTNVSLLNTSETVTAVSLGNYSGSLTLLGGEVSTAYGSTFVEASADLLIDSTTFVLPDSDTDYGLYLGAGGNLTISNVSIDAFSQSVTIGGPSSSALTAVGGTTVLTNNNLNVSNFTVVSNGTITASGGVYTAGNTISVSSVIGTVNLINGQFTAANSIAVSGQSVNVNGTSFTGNVDSSTATAQFNGSMSPTGAVTMNGANFNGFGSISMQAYTITLTNVAFGGGQVYLTSGLSNNGTPTFGAGNALPGRVNFISGVTYGGNDVNTSAGFTAYGGNIHLN